MLEYDENGNIIYRRSTRQNNEYWRNLIGQCVFWHRVHFRNDSRTDKSLMNAYHNRFKKAVLKPVFGLDSTTKLNQAEIMEYIAECHLYLSTKKIDIYEYGDL